MLVFEWKSVYLLWVLFCFHFSSCVNEKKKKANCTINLMDSCKRNWRLLFFYEHERIRSPTMWPQQIKTCRSHCNLFLAMDGSLKMALEMFCIMFKHMNQIVQQLGELIKIYKNGPHKKMTIPLEAVVDLQWVPPQGIFLIDIFGNFFLSQKYL